MSDTQKTETYWSRMVQQTREERAQERAQTTQDRAERVQVRADEQPERAKQGRRHGQRM